MEVHRSRGLLGQGCPADGSHRASTQATASPLLLENKLERSKGENQL